MKSVTNFYIRTSVITSDGTKVLDFYKIVDKVSFQDLILTYIKSILLMVKNSSYNKTF